MKSFYLCFGLYVWFSNPNKPSIDEEMPEKPAIEKRLPRRSFIKKRLLERLFNKKGLPERPFTKKIQRDSPIKKDFPNTFHQKGSCPGFSSKPVWLIPKARRGYFKPQPRTRILQFFRKAARDKTARS
ncbi:TPA: hypothetical protein HA351_02635 [Methanosarcinaceae archaeon]|nr:hypothetical protein [Methanosarcinaceae archaeon]